MHISISLFGGGQPYVEWANFYSGSCASVGFRLRQLTALQGNLPASRLARFRFGHALQCLQVLLYLLLGQHVIGKFA